MENHELIENNCLSPRMDAPLPAVCPASPRPKKATTPYPFDAEYVRKLTTGDPEIETHFVEYFSGLLFAKLRFHLRSGQEIQEFQQEVFLRVLRFLRGGQTLHKPERLGAFVNSVCSNVLMEHFRQKSRVVQFDEHTPEPRDSRTDLEKDLVTDETRRRVRSMINELAPKDRRILQALFVDDREKDSVCQEFGVTRSHLRVLLHRARERFRRLTYAQQAISTDC
jgi:RNA polymerase sigma-70 factor (ECF subfamily)